MGEDRRIVKTKKLLKRTLVSELKNCSFEQMTVKGLCDKAEISRITFYTHYDDKYGLVDEIFSDLVEIATEDYYRMQEENNPKRFAEQNYVNLLECILNLFYDHHDFLRYAIPGRSAYMHSAFYEHITKCIEHYMNKSNRGIHPKYSSKRVTSFLANGFWSFISEAHAEGSSKEQVYAETRELMMGILKSKALFS